MFYKNEFKFLTDTFKKCNLQALLIPLNISIDPRIDLMLRKSMWGDDSYNKVFSAVFKGLLDNTIYRFADSFGLNYFFLKLPDDKNILLSVGPYLTHDINEQKVLELAEKNNIQASKIKKLEQFYAGVPIVSEQSRIFTMLDCFAELIYGGSDNFSVVDLEPDVLKDIAPLNEYSAFKEQDPLIDMQIMEQRYAHENKIIRAVALGQSHKIEQLLKNFSQISFERRLSDPIRNLKNYCIIMNTLLRKAAEQGGVHPIYINKVSSDYAIKIEQLSTTADVQSLMEQMFFGYCRLVKKHATRNYSAIVQKTVVYIDSDLCADLKLSSLAQMHNVSASYLSAQFKKETGSTLTEYVNNKRIKNAMHLLKTTNLQVQTVAQHSGILDMQYFTKLFKKYTGQTPKEFRASS
ncbi:MAG: helix-turn-helix domain-containing protein [Clostridia bacterium]|nr:helix-turn-helix domain-containing protein [Clostridia bacterium]